MDHPSQELAALYRAETRLLERANEKSKLAKEIGEAEPLRAAALRGQAVGLRQGAQQVASVSRSVRSMEVS